eukprot:6188374-Prymnesium_polylepis.1
MSKTPNAQRMSLWVHRGPAHSDHKAVSRVLAETARRRVAPRPDHAPPPSKTDTPRLSPCAVSALRHARVLSVEGVQVGHGTVAASILHCEVVLSSSRSRVTLRVSGALWRE